MVDPYNFIQEIRTCQWDHVRPEWAALALDLYYPKANRPFNVSRLMRWSPKDLAIGMGAINWKLARRSETGYELGGVQVLTDATLTWLLAIEAGAGVVEANLKAGPLVF
jgi:hypothetical protein